MGARDVGLEGRAGRAVGDDHRRDVLLDQVVGLGVGRLARRVVERRGALREGGRDVGERRTELLAGAGTEVVVEEVGRIRIVGAPAQHEDAVEGAGRVRVEERTGLLEVEGGVDAEVGLQLALDLGRDLRRIREVAADRGAELQLVRSC